MRYPTILLALLFTLTSASSTPQTQPATPQETSTPWHQTSIPGPPQTINPHLLQFIQEQHNSLSSPPQTPTLNDSPNETFAPRNAYAFQNALRDPRPNMHAMPGRPSPPLPDSEAHEDDKGKDKRQVGGIGGGAGYTSTPTQMPTVWTYFLGGPDPTTYTQVFVATPDPWAGPQSGSIGLGTIQGTVGVVRGG